MSELIFMRHGNHIPDSDLIRHDADRGGARIDADLFCVIYFI